jgi:hypothetical protein
MFSSPLARYDINSITGEIKKTAETLLDYNTEIEGTIKGLHLSKSQVVVKQSVCTAQNFSLMLSDNPMGLHFSGHGCLSIPSEVGLQNLHLTGKKDEKCLLFERESGETQFVSEEILAK